MDNGLLVEARQNPFLYKFIILLIVVLAILLAIQLFLFYLRKLQSSEKWIEAHKDKITSKRDVINFSKICNLNQKETSFLWNLCLKNKIKNIIYSYKDFEYLDEFFKNEFQNLDEKGLEQRKEILFDVRYKIEQHYNKGLIISSTKRLDPGQTFTFVDTDRKHNTLTLNKNDPEFLSMFIPQSMAEEEKKLPALAKFTLTFVKDSIYYTISSRVIRYEKDNENRDILVASQTSAISPIMRRMAKRMDVKEPCLFCAAHPEKHGTKITFSTMEHQYKGTLTDISASGCSICCSMPIKKDQYIRVYFAVGDEQEEEATGVIVNTKLGEGENQFYLHIKFLEISLEVRNKIYACIYKYNTDAVDIELHEDEASADELLSGLSNLSMEDTGNKS